MTYYMGWCFLVLFFSPAFWERGGVSVFIVPGWAGEQLVSIRCQLGWRLCQGWGGGGTQPQPLCVCQRGRQCPGRGDEDTGRVGVTGGGDGTPIPFPAGWEVGQEVHRAALISAVPPTLNPGGRWDTAMRGVPSIATAPGGRILLRPVGISAQHGCGRSRTSASVECGGSPPKN